MDVRILATRSSECFKAAFQHSQGSYSDCLSYRFSVEDMIARRGIRWVSVVFTRPAIVNAHDFKSREHILCWNAIRRGFDRNEVSFETEPRDPDHDVELKVRRADIDASEKPASDEDIREYLMAKVYWLGYKLNDDIARAWVDLESEEDLDYLGASKEDFRRIAWRMCQEGLLRSSAPPGGGRPTEELRKLFEAGPREDVLMKEHKHILELAARDKLPERIDSASYFSPHVVQELVDAGFLKAIDASSHAGVAYLNPKITLAGREYLAQPKEKLEGKQMEEKEPNGGPLDFAMTIFGGASAWLAIEREYGVPKKTLGKQVSFVKDKFKRKVIFRDIEQAFLLAHHGFHKPSVILAGGVIEELLRLYLAHKNIMPTDNSLDSYIKACETNDLIKGAIPKLAHSVRQFRNIVHLKGEISPRESISKAIAKGAVSSVFAIANVLAA